MTGNTHTFREDSTIRSKGKYTYVWDISDEEILRETFFDITDIDEDLSRMKTEFNVEIESRQYMDHTAFQARVRVTVRFLDKDEEALYHIQYGEPSCNRKHLHT